MTSLSAREKMLAGAVGGIVLLLLNLLLLSAFARKNATLRAELQVGRRTEAGMRQLLAEQDLWAKRDAWIDAKQPRLSNESAAGVELLDLVRTTAGKSRLTLDHPDIGSTVKIELGALGFRLDRHAFLVAGFDSIFCAPCSGRINSSSSRMSTSRWMRPIPPGCRAISRSPAGTRCD